MSKLSNQTYTLEHPITKGERSINELTFRRPKIKDLISWSADNTTSEFDETCSLISILTGEPQLMINELDLEDYRECLEICKRFLKLLEVKAKPKEELPI